MIQWRDFLTDMWKSNWNKVLISVCYFVYELIEKKRLKSQWSVFGSKQFWYLLLQAVRPKRMSSGNKSFDISCNDLESLLSERG